MSVNLPEKEPYLDKERPVLTVVGPHSTHKSSVDLWGPMHGQFNDVGVALARIEDLAESIQEAGLDINSYFVDQSLRVMTEAYSQYNDPEPTKILADGHAFISPSRLSANNMDTLGESLTIFPFLKTVDLLAAKEAGLDDIGTKVMRLAEITPPRIFESYENVPGGIIYTPITSQLDRDITWQSEKVKLAREIAGKTAAFAKRQGAQVVGLGATLPRITNYGQKMGENDLSDLRITTGHGGTAWLAGMMALAAFERQQEKYDGPQGIGVLGLGTMGEVLADFIADETEGIPISLYDKRQYHTGRVAEKLKQSHAGRIDVADNLVDLFRRSSVIVSALTEPIGLVNLPKSAVEGKVIIDDSQPSAFKRQEAIDRGAALLWVVGHSDDDRFARLTSWNFGQTLHSKSDLFGCEAEAAAISTVDPEKQEDYVINHAASTASIRKIGGLFLFRRVSIAKPQSYGTLTDV